MSQGQRKVAAAGRCRRCLMLMTRRGNSVTITNPTPGSNSFYVLPFSVLQMIEWARCICTCMRMLASHLQLVLCKIKQAERYIKSFVVTDRTFSLELLRHTMFVQKVDLNSLPSKLALETYNGKEIQRELKYKCTEPQQPMYSHPLLCTYHCNAILSYCISFQTVGRKEIQDT